MDEPECMVMFATEFDTDEFLIAIVDRGNAVKMDFKSIRCNDDGTEYRQVGNFLAEQNRYLGISFCSTECI